MTTESCRFQRYICYRLMAISLTLLYPTMTTQQYSAVAPLTPPSSVATSLAAYDQLPVIFEANCGQTDARVKFLSRGSGYGLFLTATEAVLQWRMRQLRVQLIGANPASQIVGLEELPSETNYLIGRDPRRWRTHI